MKLEDVNNKDIEYLEELYDKFMVDSILKDNYIMICDSSGIYNIFELKEGSSIGKIKHPNGTMTREEMWNVLNKWIDKHEAGEVITNVEELL